MRYWSISTCDEHTQPYYRHQVLHKPLQIAYKRLVVRVLHVLMPVQSLTLHFSLSVNTVYNHCIDQKLKSGDEIRRTKIEYYVDDTWYWSKDIHRRAAFY